MTRRFSLGCALLAICAGACRQTLVLNDRSTNAGPGGSSGASDASAVGGTGGGPTDASSSDAHCHGNQGSAISFVADVAQVVVALDRSSAMNEPLPLSNPNGSSQLNAALNALQSLAQTYQPSGGTRRNPAPINLAFLDFPEAPADCNAATGCCSGDVTPTTTSQMFAAAENVCNSRNAPSSCIQSKDWPIAAALTKAHDYFSSIGAAAHSNERYVLLVTDLTDGDPVGQCSPTGNDCGDALTEVGNLSDLGVTTEVVAIGAGGSCLTELAGPAGTMPYLASSTDVIFEMLSKALSNIVQTDCRLTLSRTSSGPLNVQYGGMMQAEDDSSSSNTWSYGGDNTRIILHGSLCQSFLKNENFPNLQIFDGCGSGHFGQNP